MRRKEFLKNNMSEAADIKFLRAGKALLAAGQICARGRRVSPENGRFVSG